MPPRVSGRMPELRRTLQTASVEGLDVQQGLARARPPSPNPLPPPRHKHPGKRKGALAGRASLTWVIRLAAHVARRFGQDARATMGWKPKLRRIRHTASAVGCGTIRRWGALLFRTNIGTTVAHGRGGPSMLRVRWDGKTFSRHQTLCPANSSRLRRQITR